MFNSTTYLAPGVHDALETFENVIGWGDPQFNQWHKFGVVIDGSSRDLGNTGKTTELRPGLLMGWDSVLEKWRPYDSADGDVDVIHAPLIAHVSMQVNGADVDRNFGAIFAPGANIKPSKLFTNDGTPGPVVGHAAEAAIRTALTGLGFNLDDWYQQ